jgi:hypothetical protein
MTESYLIYLLISQIFIQVTKKLESQSKKVVETSSIFKISLSFYLQQMKNRMKIRLNTKI